MKMKKNGNENERKNNNEKKAENWKKKRENRKELMGPPKVYVAVGGTHSVAN